MLTKHFQTGIMRALLTYAISCFVILQLVDILLEPLGFPVSLIRWLTLLMLGLAPVLVGMMGLYHSQHRSPTTDAGAAEDAAVFRLGSAEVDTTKRQIRFAGRVADVQPKVFDLVEFLIRARDRIVTKEELFDEIWPSVVVSEASLTQSIKRARDLFRQNGFEQNVIRTVSRKGYQFDYPVNIATTAELVPQNPWTAIVLPTLFAAFVSLGLGLLILNVEETSPVSTTVEHASNSLAVLPFSNLSPDPEFQYFSDGLTETVTNSLTRVQGLRVIARASAFSFREQDIEIPRIGEQLQVAWLVQGSVQQDGDNLRISARLINASDGSQLWSQIYNREFDDIFSLHDDISRAIVEQMSGILTANLDLPESSRPVGDADDSEAYRLLLRGQALQHSASSQDLAAAEQLFHQALELKPDYADAMVALSGAMRVRAVMGELPRESTFSAALSLARRALSIDPESADALVQIGEIQHRHFWDFTSADASYEQAIAINPGNAAAHSAYSRFLAKAGRHREAVAEARIGLDLDPLSTNAATSLTVRLIRARELEDARGVLEEFKLRYPEHFDIPWLETNWHLSSGNYGDALQWIALEELDYLRLSLSAVTLNFLGRTGQAQQALDELIASDADGAAFQIAEVYAQWQQPDQAFEWLERAFQQGDPGLAELYSSLNLDAIHADARFPALAAKIGLPPLPVSI